MLTSFFKTSSFIFVLALISLICDIGILYTLKSYGQRNFIVNPMCGIAGLISFDDTEQFDKRLIERMSQTLVHRGPDDVGLYMNEYDNIALAFRRLSIIDLQTGSQPIANEDNSVHLICNGEIYNFKTLRKQLIEREHTFKTSGDIEPIIHLYEEFGYDFLEHIDGFFALALYDSKKKTLILSVDRFGKKPIYYTIIDRTLFFASELKAIKQVLSGSQLDKHALIDYLRFGYIPAPSTIYENVRKLPPGHVLIVRQKYYATMPELKAPPAKRYYQIPLKPFNGTYSQALEIIKTLTTRAVEKRLVADVPLGVLLSGGLDSSIITALAGNITGQRIKTFSVGFSHERYNELPLARLIAEKYNTEHTELMIDVEDDLNALLESILNVYDEPFADSSAIPMRKISQIAKQSVKVALTGDGGDETFMGYDRYRAIMIANVFSRICPDSISRLLGKAISAPGQEYRSVRTRLWRVINAFKLLPAEQYSMFMRIFYEHQLACLLTDEMNDIREAKHDLIAQTFDSFCNIKSSAIKANLTDIFTYLPGDLLTKADRASMSASLELRSPFLDYHLMEFAKSLRRSWHMNLIKGKKLLRDAFSCLVPNEILSAPKRGFGVPLGDWLRNKLKTQMLGILRKDCMLVEYNLIKPDFMKTLQSEHISGLFDNSQRLWTLMLLEKFLQENLS